MLGELRRRKQRLKPARVMAFDEMWTYVKARRKGKRREVWVWTAVVEEADGSRWVDFQVGDRSKRTICTIRLNCCAARPLLIR